MKYHCKYPSKLTFKSYAQKKFEDYKSSGRYPELLDAEMKSLLGSVLLDIHVILCSSKEKLQQNIELLLKIGSISKEEYLTKIDEEEESSYSFGALFLVMHNPKDAIDVIANNRKIEFRGDKYSQYVMFLREVTVNCIREVTEANQQKPTVKGVRFSDEVVPKSEASPGNPRGAAEGSGSMDYLYAHHRSLDTGDKKEGGVAKSKTFKLGKGGL